MQSQELAKRLLPIGLRTVATFALAHIWFSYVMPPIFEFIAQFRPSLDGPEEYVIFALGASALHTFIAGIGFSLGQVVRRLRLSRGLHALVLVVITALFCFAVGSGLSYAFEHKLRPVHHFAERFFVPPEPVVNSSSFRWPWQRRSPEWPPLAPPPRGWAAWLAPSPHRAFAVVGSVTMSCWLLVAALAVQWDLTKEICYEPVFQAKVRARRPYEGMSVGGRTCDSCTPCGRPAGAALASCAAWRCHCPSTLPVWVQLPPPDPPPPPPPSPPDPTPISFYSFIYSTKQ